MGAILANAFSVAFQLAPRMLPLSSMRKTVSNWARNESGWSGLAAREPPSLDAAGKLGAVVEVAETGVYAGGGSE